MTERPLGDGDALPLEPGLRSAGALLKAAREKEGLQLAVLAATIKVSPAKLDALEKDRWDDLPNATFARALAQSVCRSLKIDPRPVLALLPQLDAPALENAVGRLNTPFDERSSRSDGSGFSWASKPMFWTGGVLLAAAVVLALLPREWIDDRDASPAALPASAAASAGATTAPAASLPAGAVPSLASAAQAVGRAGVAAVQAAASLASAAMPALPAPAGLPATPPAAAASAAPAAQPSVAPLAARPALSAASAAPAASPAPPAAAARTAGVLVTASAASWVEVLDADGQALLSRVVQPGESVALDGRRPLRVKVGNAAATQLSHRGAPVDLAPFTRDNVARVELR